jgi:serine/threonine-protein kinase
VHEPPQTIGKYRITDLLGQGAMGVVYRALDPQLNRYVAIKLMGQSVASDSQLRERFLREAQAAGSLQHPNIITIFDFGEVDSHLFIAMEYIDGADLSEIMDRRDPLPLPGKLDIIIDVLHALDYAHTKRVIHRDIKPANIRVGMDGRAKLMDFGIARIDASDLTQTGMLIGTPNYMAPEQVTNAPLSPATDIFSLGVVLYEFLTYRRTFPGDTLHAVLYKVVSEQPPPLRDVMAGLPPALQPIVDKALAKDPAARYQTANEMAQALSAVRTAMSAGGPVTIASRRTPLAAAAEPPRRRALLIGGGLAAVALVSAIGYGLATRRSAPDPVTPPAAPTATADQAAAAAGSPAPAAPGPAADPALASRPPVPSPGTRATQQLTATARPGSAVVADPARSEPAPTATITPTAVPVASAPAPVVASPSPAPAAPALTPAPQPAAPTMPLPATNPREDLERLVGAYARAIESRSVAEIRRVYPGLTTSQQQGWEQFFQSVRSLRARLAITRLDFGDQAADLSVSGSYDYDGSGGRTEHQAVTFRATAANEGGTWTLRTVR